MCATCWSRRQRVGLLPLLWLFPSHAALHFCFRICQPLIHPSRLNTDLLLFWSTQHSSTPIIPWFSKSISRAEVINGSLNSVSRFLEQLSTQSKCLISVCWAEGNILLSGKGRDEVSPCQAKHHPSKGTPGSATAMR